MLLFVILGVVVLLTFIVLGVLFFMLSKEGEKKEEKVVPLTDLNQLKKEFSSGLLEPQSPKVSKLESQIIPPFEPPKVSILQAPSEVKQPPLEVKQAPLENDVYKKRAQELEEELKAITLEADGHSSDAKQLIETLTKENETLKSQQATLVQAQQKLNDLEGETSHLKTENVNLQTRLELADGKVHLLEEQMSAFKIQMGEEISRANAAVTELTREKEALLSEPKVEPDQVLRQELETLKSEHAQFIEKYKDLEKANQQLQALNVQLNEKHDGLQYELIKLRAQSSGLERVSFNYKNQLEDFLKKINEAQASNEQLSQVKNRLEGVVEEVKLQNEELAQKDQLAQFELEKNRSRLASLEREYEEFKARIQQNDSQ